MASPSASEQVHADDYLTDGKRLIRVIDVTQEWVEVEDCALVDMSPSYDGSDAVYHREQIPASVVSRSWRKVTAA